MAWSTTLTNDEMSGVTTAEAVAYGGTDWKIQLNPGEVAQGMVDIDSNGTSGDVFTFTVFCSNLVAPGPVPDDSTTLAESDWSKYTAITVDDSESDQEAVFHNFTVSTQPPRPAITATLRRSGWMRRRGTIPDSTSAFGGFWQPILTR